MSTPVTALVISGGGSKGAFAVGAIRSMYERYRQDGWFSIVGGSSTGGLIAPFAALLGLDIELADKVLEELVETYGNVQTKDIIERHGPIESILKKGSLHETQPLRRIIETALTEERFEILKERSSPICYVVYTSFTTGKSTCVSPRDNEMTRERFIDAMLASASVPVVMQATIIDGESCYDGGARDVLPLRQAVEFGAEVIVPIFLDPEYLPVNEQPLLRIDRVLYRSVAIMLDEILANDIQEAVTIQRAVHLRNRLFKTFGKSLWGRRKLKKMLADPFLSPLIGEDKKLHTILPGIRPKERMTSDSLKFDPVQMRRWIEQGAAGARATLTISPFTITDYTAPEPPQCAQA